MWFFVVVVVVIVVLRGFCYAKKKFKTAAARFVIIVSETVQNNFQVKCHILLFLITQVNFMPM